MSRSDAAAIDMIRLNFTANPTHRAEIEEYLSDLGLDVFSRDDGHFVAMIEEPETPLDDMVGHLWEINGEPFEVTHEEFSRLNLLVYHHEPDSLHPIADDRSAA